MTHLSAEQLESVRTLITRGGAADAGTPSARDTAARFDRMDLLR